MMEMLQGLWFSMTSKRKIITGVISHNKGDIIFLKELVEKGVFKPVLDRIYPLEQIVEAHAYVEKGHKRGNIAVSI
jgi:NADPH:quinone reductase-like Zn-dependent oxidoreductase